MRRPAQLLAPRGSTALAALAASRWLPLALAIAGIGVAVLLWRSLLQVEATRLAFLSEAQARSAAGALQKGIQDRIDVLARMGDRYRGQLRGGRWDVELQGVRAILWAEPSGKVGWVTPSEGNENLAGFDLAAGATERAALTRSAQTRNPVATPSLVLPGGDTGLYLLVPVADAGQVVGFLVAVLPARTFYPVVLDPDTAPGWALAVFEGGWERFRRGSPVGERWLSESKVTLQDTERSVRAGPGPEVVAHMRSALPAVVLASGSTIALLFAAVVALAQSTHRRARAAEEAQTALRLTESRFRNIVTTAREGISTLDAERRITYVNPRIAEMLGRPPDELLGRSLFDFMIGEPGPKAAEPRRLPGESSDPQGDVHFRRKDHGDWWASIATSPFRDPNGEIEGTLVMVMDVTARRAAEETLAAGERRYRDLFEANPQPMWVYDRETLRFLAVNDAAVQHYGYSRAEFRAMTLLDVQPLDDVPGLLERVAVDIPIPLMDEGPSRHRKKDGSVIEVERTSHALTFEGRRARLVMITDLTERKKLEVQLRQAQRMEAVGRLAGGIAHDFNNLLTVITGHSELMQRKLQADHPALRNLEETRKAIARATAVTRQLLAFSRHQILVVEDVDLNARVTDVGKMLAPLLGEDIKIVTVLEPDLWRIQADRGQIDQVLMNLAINSRDAMPEGGTLTIETANVELDAAYQRRHLDSRPGPHVRLTMSDTGLGIEDATLSHIFEPFYTTKEQGRGTGLGLSTVYGIIKQSGGHISVYSEPGRGSAFQIYLPKAEGPATRQAEPAASPAPRGGTETILVVEDEQAVRQVAREVLEEHGYRVLDARSGEEAIRICETHVGPIHLVVSDLVMPGLSGHDVVERIGALRPTTRVLVMSGYSERTVTIRTPLKAGIHFIGKPFTSEALLRKVREVLDAKVD
jgi:PAS domain S-box-containing protein